VLLAVVALLALVTADAAAQSAPVRHSAPGLIWAVIVPFPAGARVDYQIGGGYSPAADVVIVDRDRTDRPVPGRYNICYLNAFQTQPQEDGWWRGRHPSLLLHDSAGREVVDPDWGETLLDLRTPAKRAALAAIVGSWIDGCGRAGFRAIEPDNLDSYTRSHGLLTPGEAVAFATGLAARAHLDGLAIGQKNTPEFAGLRARVGFDFGVAEECQVYDECDAYTRVYGRNVIEIEYTDNSMSAFTAACRLLGRLVSVLLADRDLVPAGELGHARGWC
jgi:hypothetical protein